MMMKKITLIFCFLFLNPCFTNAVGKDVKTPDGGMKGQEEDLKKQLKKEGDFFFGYLNLVGTVLISEDDRKFNKAIFTDVFTRKKITYYEGSVLPFGIKLKIVEKNSVVLEKKGLEKSLFLRDKINYFGDIKALRRYGYQQIAQNEWVVNSHYLFRSSKDMIKLAVDSGLALKRSRKNPGVEIAKKPNKRITGLGFQKGDTVIDINGTSLDGLLGLALPFTHKSVIRSLSTPE
jgi:hypothetical protein